MTRGLKIFIIIIALVIISAVTIAMITPLLVTNESFLQKLSTWIMPKPQTVENPMEGIATIQSIEQTNATRSINNHLSYQLKIMVNVVAKEGKTAWPAIMKEFIPVEYISQLEPGRKLQVLYNAKDSTQVTIPDGKLIIQK